MTLRSPVFLGLARPPKYLGLPIGYLVVLVVGTVIPFVLTKAMWVLLLGVRALPAAVVPRRPRAALLRDPARLARHRAGDRACRLTARATRAPRPRCARSPTPRPSASAIVGENLPYVSFVADDVMMLRQGDLMATLELGGVDPMTTPERQLDALKLSLAGIIAQTGSAFGTVVHRLPMPQDLRVRPIEAGRDGEDAFAAAIDEAWRARVAGMGLQRRALFLSVMRRPALGSGIPVLGALMGRRAFGADRAARMEELQEVMGFLEASLGAARPVRG